MRSLALSIVFTAAAALYGCNVTSSELTAVDGGLCQPTGRSYVQTGVFIGPGGCTEVTLYANRDADPTYWTLRVGFPVHGSHPNLRINDVTTGDQETEIVYTGDPDFTLYSGDYYLGGLQMVAGRNDLHYRLYHYDDGSTTETVLEESSFVVNVVLSASTGG